MGCDINYATFAVPVDKPATEFTYAERRADLYDRLQEAGHPRNLQRSQADLADIYGVTQQQISQDIKRIKDFENERIGRDADTTTQFVCTAAVRHLMDEGKYEEAAKVQLQYYEWLQDTGRREKEPDKMDIEGSMGHDHTHAMVNLGAYSGGDHDHDQGDSEGDPEATGSDGLTQRQRQQVDALTGGSTEIPVEAVSSDSDTDTDTDTDTDSADDS